MNRRCNLEANQMQLRSNLDAAQMYLKRNLDATKIQLSVKLDATLRRYLFGQGWSFYYIHGWVVGGWLGDWRVMLNSTQSRD